MFSVIQEDHESAFKRKPRLPQSQGGINGCNPGPLRLLSISNKNISVLQPAPVKLQNISTSPVQILDYRRVAKTLALAFDKDPFCNYVLNTKIEYPARESKHIRRKADLFVSFFEYYVYECMSLGGLVVVIKDNNLELELIQLRLKPLALSRVPFLGVACWNKLIYDKEEECFDYPHSLPSFANMHPTSIKFNVFKSLARCRQKVSRCVTSQLENERDSVLERMLASGSSITKNDPIWYLSDIGILPSMQGQGLAKKLMNHCLENYMLDHWCYLESSNQANRAFYTKMGWTLMNTFEVDEEMSEVLSSSDEGEFSSLPPKGRRGSFGLRERPKVVATPREALFMDSFVLRPTRGT